ncbi:MAG: M6 family metalloprotease domain-containing protein, partial [Paludibacter sp.]
TQLTIRLQGDEHQHFQATEDGYVLKANEQGFLTYATVSSMGELVASNTIAKNTNKRTASEVQFLKTINQSAIQQTIQSFAQKIKMSVSASTQPRKATSYPHTGSPKALVILANFKDKAFSVASPLTSYQDLTTKVGYSANGGTGSAKDYFMASTYGKFAPDFVVVGPVTLPQTLDYYGKNDASGSDTNPAKMIVDACNAANVAGLDFTQFDTDGDGFIDNVFVYYAGYNEAEGAATNTIWPHRWNISSAGITTGITFDGKKIEDYSCTSELNGTTGTNMCGIGTFSHEFGHVIGLPDFYHTASSLGVSTLDYWDIMDVGAYNNNGCTPPTYSTYERFFLGYSTPQQVSAGSDLTLLPIYQGTTTPANSTNQSYLFSATTHNLVGNNPTPKEFFMVEYRPQIGWDKYLPGDGMLIWHVDYDQDAWDANTPNNYTGTSQTAASHMRLYLQPLVGSTTTPGAAFSTGSFTPTTWSGTNINRAITSIVKTTNNVTFKLIGGYGLSVSTNTISSLNYDNGNGPSSEKTFFVNGNDLISDIVLSPPTNFQISKTSGTGFTSLPISLTQSNGSVATTNIYVRLKAGLSKGDYQDNIVLTSSGLTTQNITCIGTVVGPTITTSTSTLSSFSSVNGTVASSTKSFTFSGSLLEANLIITPTISYEISTNGSTFLSTPLTYTPISGTISSSTLYVRLKAGLSVGAYTENITLTSTGGVSKTITCSGNVLGPNITLSTNTISSLNYAFDNGPSDQQYFTISGVDLTANVVLTPNANLQISTVSGGSFVSTPITLTQTGGILSVKTIYIRLKAGLVAANYNGNITISSTNADTKTIAYSGTVDNGTGLTYTVTVPASTKACYINGTMNGATFQAMNKV